MEYRITKLGDKKILEILPESGLVIDEASALDLVSFCGAEETDILLLYASNLSEDFYDLKTGFAGTVLLKLSNYRIRAAVVIPPEKVGSGRFYEMVLETNRRNEFTVYPTREEALRWIGRLSGITV